MSKEKKNAFLVQGTILALASIMVRFVGIIYRIPLQRLLGDEGMGYYSTAYEIYSVLLILSSFSLPTAISKLVSTRVAKKEYENVRRLFFGGIVIAIIFGGIAAIVLYVFSDNLAHMFKFDESALALRTLAPTLFLVAIMGVLRGFFQGFGSTVPTAISQIIEKIVQVALSLILCRHFLKLMAGEELKLSYAAMGATMGNCFGAIAGLLFLVFGYVSIAGFIKKKSRKQKKQIMGYGEIFTLMILTIIPVLLSTTVNNISNICDNFIVGNVLTIKGFSDTEIARMWGILSNKYRTFITLPVSVASALAVSTMPSMSKAVAVGDNKLAMNKIGLSVRFVYLFSAPCAVGVMILANPLLQLLYYDGVTGNEMGTYLLWIGCVTIILSSLVAITNAILQGLGHLNVPVIHCVIGLIVHIIVAVACMMIFNLSIYSIVVAEIALTVTVLILNFRFIFINYDYRQEIKRTFVIPSICAAIMGCFISATYYLLRIFTHSRVILLMIPFVVAVVVYFVMLFVLGGLNEKEIEQFPKGRYIIKFYKMLHLIK